MKIAREICGEYSFYHLMIFTPWSYASGVICAGDTLLRVQVGGAKPRSACPCRQRPPFLSALTPPQRQHPLYLPPCGLWKKMPELKQSALVTHWETVRRSWFKDNKKSIHIMLLSLAITGRYWYLPSCPCCWACQDCFIICGRCPLPSLRVNCFSAFHVLWWKFESGILSYFSHVIV